ncbi:uncharacterized protein LOC128712902 [Anopheles marshallii]|uniref:uncharacterized protein LOC128712902 n=1 Tax=Anopheles marshallii TaxID=1521116 RepID=UPI00237B79BD|nr:uncharacterized protein LOC128712902 [Anopheles marshallii]
MLQPEYICRVCLAEGAWNIFSTDFVPDEMCTVASINRIQEKLQYVTQLELHENDGLPLHICELCIIQLNVAYRFKLLAAESDSKMRQTYELSELSPAVPNASTNGENDDVDNDATASETVMLKAEVFPDEICIEPTVILEENTDSWTPVKDENVSNIPPRPFHIHGMVSLQKDIINPAEDEAYLKEIVHKEVISIKWPQKDEETCDTQHSAKSTTSTSRQSKGHRKTPRKRQQLQSKAKQHGSEEGSRKRHKGQAKSQGRVSKKKENKLTKPNNGTPKQSSSTGSTKKTTTVKSADATLRKKRLLKVLNSLRIDMMYNNTVEWHEMNDVPIVETIGDPLLPQMPMKRRNSVCVSSFAPWL